MWTENIMPTTRRIKKYAVNRGALFAPQFARDAAQKAAVAGGPGQCLAAALQGGKTKVSPDTVGIAKP
jgi:hypothetical protein